MVFKIKRTNAPLLFSESRSASRASACLQCEWRLLALVRLSYSIAIALLVQFSPSMTDVETWTRRTTISIVPRVPNVPVISRRETGDDGHERCISAFNFKYHCERSC